MDPNKDDVAGLVLIRMFYAGGIEHTVVDKVILFGPSDDSSELSTDLLNEAYISLEDGEEKYTRFKTDICRRIAFARRKS